MTARRSVLARSCLAGLALAGLGAELGCSQFRARRLSSRQAAPVVGADVPTPIVGAAAGYADPAPIVAPARTTRAATPINRAEPVFEPDPLPTVGADVTSGGSGSSPTAMTTPAARGVTLQAPVADAATEPAAVLVSTATAAPGVAATISPHRADPVRPTTAVVSAARRAIDAMTTYQLQLRRQERVNDLLLPAEDLVMSIRRQPLAARLTWVDGPHRGREVLFNSAEPGGLMHVNMADSKLPIPRMNLDPTSPLVMKNSRHPITEAGLDPLIAGMEQADRAGTLQDLGMQAPTPLDHPHHGVLRRTPEGDIWRAYFDPATHLPALVDCRSASGDILEFYHFRDIQPDPVELASAAAFDPDARWGAPRGLFGRLANRPADTATR